MATDVQVITDRMELRIMELEDTVGLLTGVLRTMNQMIGTLNEIIGMHTELLVRVVGAREAPDARP